MNNRVILTAILAMFVVAYSMKMIPLIFCKKKIKNRFISSFLFYIPFAVLTSMTIPEVFTSTSSGLSAAFGVVVAVTLGFMNQGLLLVSLAATAVVFVVERIMNL
ncbi:MAG: AzlD domain-containing protein [Firmicutes bacterium]|nr:AzlD domain-containing protein [Bacillota bacterium]